MAIATPPEGSEGGDEGGEGLFADINITPLTDVFLVMVIIFMISALAVQAEARHDQRQAAEVKKQAEAEKSSGLKINLPSGASHDIDPTAQSLVLLVSVSGDVVLDRTPIPDADLDNLFRAAFARDKATQLVLQADKGVPHGRVVNLMERAKQVGLTKLTIGTSAGAP
jgi:biopolymer transport protein ExbD